MTIQRFYMGELEQLADDEVGGICISAGVKRDGCEWEPRGIDLTAFKRNPVVLRDHRPEWVIGAASAIGPVADWSAIAIRIKFAPPGVSAIADEARGLAKAGILRGISAGIDPRETEPIRGSYGGIRVLAAELLEVSLVSVPADADALVTARAFRSRPGAAAMLRALPAISTTAIEHVFASVGQVREQPRPIGLMSDVERTRLYAEEARQRTMACWAVGQANDAEAREQRRQEIERLGEVGKSYGDLG